MKIKTTCPICGKETMRNPSGAHIVTCSPQCAGKLKSLKYKNKTQRPCKICGKMFVPKHNKAPGLFCSYKCSAESRKKAVIMRNGYRFIHLPDHPNARIQGYFAEHRYIMEQHIGRILLRKEVVHHINHNKSDNRIENLMLFASAGQHTMQCHTPKWSNGRWV